MALSSSTSRRPVTADSSLAGRSQSAEAGGGSHSWAPTAGPSCSGLPCPAFLPDLRDPELLPREKPLPVHTQECAGGGTLPPPLCLAAGSSSSCKPPRLLRTVRAGMTPAAPPCPQAWPQLRTL